MEEKVKKFVIKSGGKRLRPLLHHHLAKMLDYSGNEWADIGAIGELLHAASLLHDDVVDNSEYRRGRPAISRVYNNKMAILFKGFIF